MAFLALGDRSRRARDAAGSTKERGGVIKASTSGFGHVYTMKLKPKLKARHLSSRKQIMNSSNRTVCAMLISFNLLSLVGYTTVRENEAPVKPHARSARPAREKRVAKSLNPEPT